jgi:hypothetical protein
MTSRTRVGEVQEPFSLSRLYHAWLLRDVAAAAAAAVIAVAVGGGQGNRDGEHLSVQIHGRGQTVFEHPIIHGARDVEASVVDELGNDGLVCLVRGGKEKELLSYALWRTWLSLWGLE